MLAINELIVAPATVRGFGERAIVRLSGAGLDRLLNAVFAADEPGFPQPGDRPRRVAARLAPGEPLGAWGELPVAILVWPGSSGPTGGPLAEVHLPASAVLVDAFVAAACGAGARLARGGEFSLRAFLAGRLDLIQAEAVLAVVDAKTPAELSAALDSLAGGIGHELASLRETLLDLAADIEATIDFADEHAPDAVPVADAAAWAVIDRRLVSAGKALDGIGARLAGRDAGAAADLPRVVLVGPPNIGKSSLFNAIIGREAALVADEAGTTRDWIGGRLEAADAPPCLIVDVAGIVGGGGPGTLSSLERPAFERARAEVARADVVIVCSDCRAAGPADLPPLPAAASRIDVVTRCDLATPAAAGGLLTSSRSGRGIAELRMLIGRTVAALPGGTSPATLRMRVGVVAARDAVRSAEAAAGFGSTARDEAVVAGLVRQAVAAVDAVTGVEIGTDLVDRIFSRHCIGK